MTTLLENTLRSESGCYVLDVMFIYSVHVHWLSLLSINIHDWDALPLSQFHCEFLSRLLHASSWRRS